MAWIHRGRKYWYHNGKRYSRRLKRKRNNGYFVAPKKLYTIKDIKIKTHDGYKIIKTKSKNERKISQTSQRIQSSRDATVPPVKSEESNTNNIQVQPITKNIDDFDFDNHNNDDKNVFGSNQDWDFSDNPKVNTTVAVANAAPAEITEEEKANIAELMAKLGL